MANIITAFANIDCDCPLECDGEIYIQSNMQYAQLELNSPNHYHLRHNSNETGMCSILVYQADRIIIDNERPEYTSFEFLSDVGGTAGLILGLSAASLISLGEDLFRLIYEKCKFRFELLSVSLFTLLIQHWNQGTQSSNISRQEFENIRLDPIIQV